MKNIIIKFFFFKIFFIIVYTNIFANGLNVSMISSYFDEKEFVVKLSWEPINEPKAVYKIYRILKPIDNKAIYIPDKKELITVVDYNKNYFIDEPPEKGDYYYFITVSIDNDENFKVIYDQNYTSNPVTFYPKPPSVKNIRCKFVPQGSKVFITWMLEDASKEKIKELRVYRSNYPIDRNSILLLEPVIIDKNQDFYIDTPRTGQYYYAVTSVSLDNLESLFFLPGQNYIDKPVLVINYQGLLPEFFINLPFNEKFNYSINYNLFDLPDYIDMIDIDIIKYYVEPKKEDDKTIKEKLKIINLQLEVLALKKKWEDFIKKIDEVLSDTTWDNNIKNRFLMYKAYALINLKKEDEAFLIISILKSDNEFVKLNYKKIEQLIKKIEDRKKNK
ncbi:MAG TPA: hypothetical protein PKW55_01335 [Spirochaetota bacterium]|nr:hypothetical protein [Spirochaetota bacterium]HOM38866.1 hypothetical protein [Spirochaetota bacterium]